MRLVAIGAMETRPFFLTTEFAAALAALAADRELLHALRGRAVITPHAGEMASIKGLSKEAVGRDPLATARRAAKHLRAVVVLKGRETHIAAPDGEAFRNRAGNVGLATSGSGDTLAGVIAGLIARGADPVRATLWGVFLHGEAGARLARSRGPLGFMARELPGEVPRIMAEMAS